MEPTGEPAGIVSSLVMGATFGFASFFLLEGLNPNALESRFAMEELIVLGAILGIAIHLYGKFRY